MMKAIWAPLACAFLAIAPVSSASAATFFTYTTDTSGTFGNAIPVATAGGLPVAGSFNDTFTFVTTQQTLISLFVQAIGNTSSTAASYLNFTTVKLDGTLIPIVMAPAGKNVVTRTGTLFDFRLPSGVQKIILTGNTGSAGSYVGSFELSAVPEASTWAMMIAGFGMVGATLRRKQRATTQIAFAA